MSSAVLAIIAALGTPASAQSSRPRGDAAAFFSWQAADVQHRDSFDGDGWTHSLFGGGSAGVYWTEHLKTELDVGASTSSTTYHHLRTVVGSTARFHTSVVEASRRTLGIGQQYQFYRNAWFHPHVAAGANLTWERRREHFLPAFSIDPATGRQIADPAGLAGRATRFSVRPFAAGGFKAYVSPRWFFRADARVAFRHGVEESHLRVGVGRDW